MLERQPESFSTSLNRAAGACQEQKPDTSARHSGENSRLSTMEIRDKIKLWKKRFRVVIMDVSEENLRSLGRGQKLH